MIEIHASYKRTFQIKPYETETVELSITDEIPDAVLPSRAHRGPVHRDVELATLIKDFLNFISKFLHQLAFTDNRTTDIHHHVDGC